jgi:hypothetical protein
MSTVTVAVSILGAVHRVLVVRRGRAEHRIADVPRSRPARAVEAAFLHPLTQVLDARLSRVECDRCGLGRRVRLDALYSGRRPSTSSMTSFSVA